MRCKDCGENKSPKDFPRNKNMRSGRASYCKTCHNSRGRASRARNGGARRYHLRGRYGIDLEDFDRLLKEQNGVCAVCEERPAAHVDHDHKTGDVRGIVCELCNGFMGAFNDNPELLEAAARYLEEGVD